VVAGDIESFAPPDLPDYERMVILDTGFDEDDIGLCPKADNWICSTGVYNPQVVDESVVHGVDIDPRLRLTDVTASVAAAVFLGDPVDLTSRGFEAEFTVFLTLNAGDATPADGMTFFFLPYAGDLPVPPPIGAVGNALALMAPAVAVEIDTYQGTNDPNGIPQTGSGHVGVVYNGNVSQHLQTSASYSPYAQGASWPLRLVTDNTSADFQQFVIGTRALEEDGVAGLRVKVDFNNGRLRTWVATVNDDPALGLVYPETKVLDTMVEWAVGTSDFGTGYFGFTAATGGETCYHEVDDVKITLTLNEAVEVARRVEESLFTDSSTPIDVALDLTVTPGTGPFAVEVVETLPAGWTARGISSPGSFAGGKVTWSLAAVSADTTLTYQAVPDDATKVDVEIAGTFSVALGPELPIEPSKILYAPPELPRGASRLIISEGFDDYAEGECPEGWTCNGGNAALVPPFKPGVTQKAGFEGRLRLTESAGSIPSTVIWNTPIDLTESSFVASFDAYFSLATGTPADGLTFMILDGSVSTPTALGAVGGGEAYLGLTGLAVELDLYQGGADPSGYNTAAVAYAHMAVVRDGVVATHVQTSVQYDPDLAPTTLGGTGWPEFVDRVGTGTPLTVEVDYNNGRVRVYLSAPATGAQPAFDRVQVLDTAVTFPGSAGVEPVLQSAYLGFSAATGGSFATQEVDDVTVRVYGESCNPVPEVCNNGLDDDCDGKTDCADEDCAAAPNCQVGVRFIRGDVDASGPPANITDGIYILNYLFTGGDAPPCFDAADTDNSGTHNITDGIYILNYLFTGGAAPPPPLDGSGLEQPDDVTPLMGCAEYKPCQP
jgi:hypothetical protein